MHIITNHHQFIPSPGPAGRSLQVATALGPAWLADSIRGLGRSRAGRPQCGKAAGRWGFKFRVSPSPCPGRRLFLRRDRVRLSHRDGHESLARPQWLGPGAQAAVPRLTLTASLSGRIGQALGPELRPQGPARATAA
jgi:hypothetical protein